MAKLAPEIETAGGSWMRRVKSKHVKASQDGLGLSARGQARGFNVVFIVIKGKQMKDRKAMLLAAHPDFDPEKVWVLLWSKAQGALHKETLAQMFEGHARAFAEDRGLQYVPLLIGDREVIDDLARKITPTVAARYNAAHDPDTGFIPYEELP